MELSLNRKVIRGRRKHTIGEGWAQGKAGRALRETS